MTALHVFDMDGTLLRGTTANLEIARHLDCVDAVTALEGRFACGDLDEAALSAALVACWGALGQDEVDAVAAASPWIDGIDEVCADIAARGETSMLITMSPEFFARHLHRRGVDVIRGASYPPLPVSVAVDPAGLLTPRDKVRLADDERRRRGVATAACVAYGDSVSDEPLFAHLEHTVAVNASPRVAAAASVDYRGDDLREAYAHGRALLEGRR